MEENSINNMAQRAKDLLPKNYELEDEQPLKNIISGAGTYGVEGIDMPLSGTLLGKARN